MHLCHPQCTRIKFLQIELKEVMRHLYGGDYGEAVSIARIQKCTLLTMSIRASDGYVLLAHGCMLNDSESPRYIFLRYCPPTSNIAAVSCPSDQYFVASISTANILSFLRASVRSYPCSAGSSHRDPALAPAMDNRVENP